jgi:hypothetical protein
MISTNGAKGIYYKSMNASVSGMFDLANILEAIDHTLDNASFSEHYFIIDGHEFVFHIAFNFCNKVDSIVKEFFKNRFFYQVPFIAIKFAKEVFAKFEQQVFIVVCYVAACKLKVNDLGLIIDNKVKFKPKKPSC